MNNFKFAFKKKFKIYTLKKDTSTVNIFNALSKLIHVQN